MYDEKDKKFLKMMKDQGATPDEAFSRLQAVKGGTAASQPAQQSNPLTEFGAGAVSQAPQTAANLGGFGFDTLKAIPGSPLGFVDNFQQNLQKATGQAPQSISQQVQAGGGQGRDWLKENFKNAGVNTDSMAGKIGGIATELAGTLGGGIAGAKLGKLVTTGGEKAAGMIPRLAGFAGESFGGTQGAQAVMEGKKSSVQDLLMGLGIDSSLSALGKLGKTLSKETLQKSTSLPMNVFETAYKQGDDLSRVQNIGADEASNQLFGKLKGKLDDSITNLSETGKGYAEIRKSGEKLALPTTWFDDALDSVGLKPTKQGIKATADSAIRDAADLNQLDEVYRRYANIKNPTANQVLNLRSDLSNLVEKSLNKTDMKVFTTKLRGFVDESAKKGLTGLTNLDEAYSSQKQFFDKIKTDFFSKNKDLKDNTATLIQRLGNPSNVKKLDRLEELLPGLKEEVKLIKATQAIEGAQGNQVGNYVRSALTGGSAITGNVPGALLAVASNPKVATGIAKQLGKAAPVINKVAKYTPPIISSLAKYLALPRSKQQ